MKLFVGPLALLVLLVAMGVAMAGENRLQCEAINPDMPDAGRPNDSRWKVCMESLRRYIDLQMVSAHNYLFMGGHFMRDVVNRAGLGGYFMQLATQKRQLSKDLIDYMLMRGELSEDVDSLLRETKTMAHGTWINGAEAFEDALKMETAITEHFKKSMKVCERYGEDVVVHLTHQFLPMQQQLLRELSSKLHSLKSMLQENKGALGELMFDLDLLL